MSGRGAPGAARALPVRPGAPPAPAPPGNVGYAPDLASTVAPDPAQRGLWGQRRGEVTWHYLSGDALVGLSTLPNFRADFSDGYWHVGGVAVPVMAAATASTLVEYFLALAFWFPGLRWVAAAVGVAFHVLLTTIVRIFMLDLATMFLYLAFLLPFAGTRAGTASSLPTPVSRGVA